MWEKYKGKLNESTLVEQNGRSNENTKWRLSGSTQLNETVVVIAKNVRHRKDEFETVILMGQNYWLAPI